VLIVAHRGSSGLAPENTMAAFKLAIDEGADMIELDVRLTRDGELVIIHDRTLRRTTDGKGAVFGHRLDALKQFDAGSWFAPRFKDERIPTLREALAILPSYMKLNIEVKTDGERRRTECTRRLSDALHSDPVRSRLIVSSFDHRFLRQLRRFDPSLNLGVLYWPVRDLGKKPSHFQRTIGATTFACSHTQLRKRWVKDAHDHGMHVACYTVNTERQLRRMVRYSVDAVITNVPGQVRKWLDS
jgi:glycerophosphoryl diester phosphodiesterase